MKMKPIHALLAAVLCASSFAATAAITKDQHKAATKDAEMTYKSAKAACSALAGNAKDVCVAEAKVVKAQAIAKTDGEYKTTTKQQYDGREDVASAEYALAKAKCGSKAGNEKNVCIKEAKAGTKMSEARTDASDEKRKANYKVAAEKCDAFAGDTKDVCIKEAKARFNM